MNWLVETFREYPEIAIFFTLALGFFVGGLKFGKFSLGNVTGVLLAGVLIGQMNIVISPNVKSVFFLMFLFAVGYGVGPQFFRGLKSDGLPQVLFAVILCVACLFSAVIAAAIADYSIGQAAGLLAGACTISAVLGVATDTLGQIGLTPEQIKANVDAMPVAYAVTYLFGTAGSAWFLATVGPKILGVDLARACADYEAKMGGTAHASDQMSVYRRLSTRAYQVGKNSDLAGKTVEAFEAQFSAPRISVLRLRNKEGKVVEAEPKLLMEVGDVVGMAGARELLLQVEANFGKEVDDRELFDVPMEILDVVITNKAYAGWTLQSIRNSKVAEQARGVFLRKLVRGGQEMPFNPGTKVDRGDVLQLIGPAGAVNQAAKELGYADRATEQTDMVFMGLGITLGALIGALVVKVGQVPLSLSTSGGALLAGLVCGYLRAVNPTFGRIPAPALWVFNNVGLTAFIAVVGISCGPGFVSGLKEAGVSLLLWGIFVTTAPFVVGLLAGKYIFKMHPGINLGACAGARTTTAALGAITDAAKSNVPALGYTITYAVGNVLLITWGVVLVLILK
jgi:putative transport protein